MTDGVCVLAQIPSTDRPLSVEAKSDPEGPRSVELQIGPYL